MIILLILSVIFGIMSISLLLGKGSCLISGYNTANEEEKGKYNEKKLCRTIGIMLLLIAIATGLLAIVNNKQFVIGYTVFVVVNVIVSIIYSNTSCRNK